MVAMINTSCQTKTKVAPVDLAAAKATVTELLDKFSSGMKSKDANALTSLFTDDCGKLFVNDYRKPRNHLS